MAKISFRKTGEGSGEFQPIPAGSYGAGLRAIWIMGTHVNPAYNSRSLKAIFEWEIDYNPNGNTKNPTVWQFVSLANGQGALTSGSSTGKMLIGWLGEAYFEKNPEFEVSDLIDKFATIVLTVNEKGKNEVTGVGPLNPKLAFEMTHDGIMWDVREDLDLTATAEVVKWVVEQGKQSIEYQQHKMGQTLLPDPPKPAPLPEVKPGSDLEGGAGAPVIPGSAF